MSTATQTATTTRLKTPSMWKVLLLNDDFTPMDFVTEILMHVFHKTKEEAEDIMMTVHTQGKANVGLYTKEVAVTKVRQVTNLAEMSGHPLRAEAEEA